MSRYAGSDTYVYPNSEVLRNKADIREQAGYFIDFDLVDRDEMYAVMAASFKGDEKPLATLLERITAIVE